MTRTIIGGMLIVCAAFGAACKGGESAPKPDPAKLGEQIGRTYLDMMAEVGPVLAGASDPAALRAPLAAIRDKYIAAFVALGRQRELLQPNDRQACDEDARAKMAAVPSETLDALGMAVAAAKSSDPDLAKELGDIQRLTRYTSFETLRTQMPDEAARLGVH